MPASQRRNRRRREREPREKKERKERPIKQRLQTSCVHFYRQDMRPSEQVLPSRRVDGPGRLTSVRIASSPTPDVRFWTVNLYISEFEQPFLVDGDLRVYQFVGLEGRTYYFRLDENFHDKHPWHWKVEYLPYV